MSKDSSAKYYKSNKKRLQKKVSRKNISSFILYVRHYM